MKLRFILFAFTLLFFQTNLSINAQPGCSPESPASIIKKFEYVFVGKVLGYKQEKNGEVMDVAVLENFRGMENRQTVSVSQASDCQGRRNVGEDYLFVTKKNAETGLLNSHEFSGEYKSYETQRQYIEYLRWKTSSRKGGIIVGKVLAEKFGEVTEKLKPADLNKILLQDENGIISETQIENDGFYKFTDLMPGKYTIILKLPIGIMFSNEYAREKTDYTINEDEGAIINFEVAFKSVISGKITNSKNVPLKSMFVILYLVDKSGKETMISAVQTGEDGSYKFNRLMPGNYIIETFPIKFDEDYSPKTPFLDVKSEYPITYFPNIREKNKAVKLHLNLGENLTDADIYLESLQKRLVKGRVLYEDETPAQNADIFLNIARSMNEKFGQPSHRFETVTKTDNEGNFSFYAYSNTKYRVRAILRTTIQEVNHLFRSDCAELPETGEIPPLEFFLGRQRLLMKNRNSGCLETDRYFH
jgi:hypothetical protein